MIRLGAVAVCVAGSLALAPAAAEAATITVNTTNDELNGDADCSLREAVHSARQNAADTTGCVNGEAGAVDTIVLLNTTYTLDVGDQPNPTNENANLTGDLDFDGGDVVVRGAGRAETTVRTLLNDRIFDASAADTATLTLESLTVQDGNLALALNDESGGNVRLRSGGNLIVRDVGMVDGFAHTGGAVYAAGTGSVTIEDSEIEANQARGWGGALNAATGMVVRINRSTFGSNTVTGSGSQLLGGAISNLTSSVDGGSMTITDSLVLDNTVVNLTGNAVGGGIRNRGALTLRSSLIAGNRVNSIGPDTSNQNGGGFWQESGPATIVNSTFYDNDAGSVAADDASGGGVYVNSGTATLNHVTFLSNSAEAAGDSLATGDGAGSGLTVGRSIIPGPGIGGDPCNAGTLPLASSGSNASVSNDPGCGFIPSDTTSGALGTVPGGPQDNGGPTPTIAILSTGTAFNKVPAANCGPAGGADQRGFPRPFQGQACDAGAYELLSCPGTSTPLNSPGGVPACLLPQPQPQPQPQPTPVPPTTSCAGKTATITGTDGADSLTGTPGHDVIAALGGKDTVRGLDGNDLICGGAGKDRLIGGAGKDRLLGEAGKDKLVGGKGKDTCKGGKAKDRASGCEKRRSI